MDVNQDASGAATSRQLLYSLQYEGSPKEVSFNKYLFTASRIALNLKQYGKYVAKHVDATLVLFVASCVCVHVHVW